MLQGGTSTIATIFLIVNAALGAGLLNFPKAFDQAGGVLVAVLVQVASRQYIFQQWDFAGLGLIFCGQQIVNKCNCFVLGQFARLHHDRALHSGLH